MEQCPPGPYVSHWDNYNFLQIFAEIFATLCLLPVSMTPAINYRRGDDNKLLPGSLAPGIAPCPRIFIDFMTPAVILSLVTMTPTGDNLLTVATTSKINLSPVVLLPALIL
jgi:hypothetical protein